MRKLLIILTVLFLSSSCYRFGLIPYKEETIICSCKTDDYPNFNHEFLDISIDTIMGKDTLRKADILFELNEINDSTSYPYYKDIYCYCLLISKMNSISNARYYFTRDGYAIAQKYDIKEFTRDNINYLSSKEHQAVNKHFLGSFRISRIDSSYINEYTSENLTSPFLNLKLSNIEKRLQYSLIFD